MSAATHLLRIFSTGALSWLSLTVPALAEPPPRDDKKLDLTFRLPGDADTWIRPNVRWDAAWFAGVNVWGGNTRANIGDQTHGFAELGLVPGVDAQVSLGDYGTLRGRLSGVFTTTQLGLDFAGTNFYDGKTQSPHKFTLEDCYVGWKSGGLFPSLGKDALDVSVGAQQYIVGPGDLGNGFIFRKGGFNGGRRGGFWVALRNAFQFTTVAKLKTGALDAEAVLIRADEGGDDTTTLAGANVSYDFGERLKLKLAKLGVGYWNVFDSDDPRRDGLNVVNVRADVTPLRGLEGLRFTGEMVKENNGSKNDSWGAWGELGYDFAAGDVPWKPYVSYRYAYFSGDDLRGTNTAFDPLFYGYTDWNYWFIGEIAGEWVTGNSNFSASIVRLRANPVESLTAQLFWIYQRLDQLENNVVIPPGGGPNVDPRVLDITDRDLSHEIDLIFDWEVNDHVLFSFVGAVLVPLKGGKQFFGNDKPWTQFMLYWSVTF